MPTEKFQFSTFASNDAGGGVEWSNPGNAAGENGFATAALSASNPTTELLVCTGADLSGIPDNAIFTSIKVRIKGQFSDSFGSAAQIHEIYAWKNGTVGAAVAGRNQAGGWDMSEGTGPIDLDTTNTIYSRGANNWKWWHNGRLRDSDHGVAIRAQRLSGSPTVMIDHVEFEVSYLRIFQKWPVVDYRAVAYEKLAGPGTGNERNESEHEYHPTKIPDTGTSWHDEPQEFLNELIELRTKLGLKRMVFGTPAGHLGAGPVSSSQWEPMYDDQRTALMTVIPAWLKEDPEHEAIMYLGTNVPNDPGILSMLNAEEPDVNNSEHVAKLERTYFPYRDLVGIKRFLLDASSAVDVQNNRQKAKNLFQWARDNGMEFVMEAIPVVGEEEDLDKPIVETYSAYALSGFIIGDADTRARDPDLEWDYTKGRMLVQVRKNDHPDELGTPRGQRAFFKRFAREGYVLMPDQRIASLDEAARIVSAENIGRGVSFPVAGPVTFSAANSATRFFEAHRTRSRTGVR